MKGIFAAFLLLTLPIITVYSQTLKTINLEFTRTTEYENTKEIVKGNIYYDGTKTTVKTIEPLSQWMILEENKILLYYPDEEQAIRIKSKNPTNLPFFQTFVGVVKEDYGLSELGFKLEESEIKGDTLFFYWSPPENAQKFLSQITLALENNKIVFTEVKDPHGKTAGKIIYENHFLYGTTNFPLEITTIKYSKTDTIIEKIVYSNPVFDKPLPPQVVNFNIPKEIKIKELEW
jgi:hypothetical protein